MSNFLGSVQNSGGDFLYLIYKNRAISNDMGSEKFFLFCCSVLALTSYLDNGVKSKLSDCYLFVKNSL